MLKSKYIVSKTPKETETNCLLLPNRLFDDEIKQQQETATKKWGFDFRTGQPTASPIYSWERVVVPEVVPEMYTLTRAAHIRENITEPPTEQDILMDDRSTKENSIEEILSFPFKTPSSPSPQSSSTTSPSKMILSCHKSLGKRQPRITGKCFFFYYCDNHCFQSVFGIFKVLGVIVEVVRLSISKTSK